jgi:hypothetical protein
MSEMTSGVGMPMRRRPSRIRCATSVECFDGKSPYVEWVAMGGAIGTRGEPAPGRAADLRQRLTRPSRGVGAMARGLLSRPA